MATASARTPAGLHAGFKGVYLAGQVMLGGHDAGAALGSGFTSVRCFCANLQATRAATY